MTLDKELAARDEERRLDALSDAAAIGEASRQGDGVGVMEMILQATRVSSLSFWLEGGMAVAYSHCKVWRCGSVLAALAKAYLWDVYLEAHFGRHNR